MSLDLSRLENVRQHGNKLTARCPACAEAGSDNGGDHLFINVSTEKWGCVVNQADAGDAHRDRIFELVGIRGHPGKAAGAPLLAPQKPTTAKPGPRLPPLRLLPVDEMAAIARMRGWPLFVGLELLSRRGLLWFGMVWDAGKEWPAWIITDSARRNAQARRMDGQPWQGIGGKKAKSLPGSEASWPIGASEIGARPFVMLCEGQPDFCAALLVAWFEGQAIPSFSADQVAPVCMTGAGQSIHPDAQPSFWGKHVRIPIHKDEAGQKAAKRWADQLYRAGAISVDGFNFAGSTRPDGQPVDDLADFAMQINLESSPLARALKNLPQIELLTQRQVR